MGLVSIFYLHLPYNYQLNLGRYIYQSHGWYVCNGISWNQRSPEAPGGGAMPDMSKMNVAWLKILKVHLKRTDRGVG